jgi:hypothetical protein
MRAGLALLLVAPLCAQSQTTFYAAWEDGLDAEQQHNWKAALPAYQRAHALRPKPGAAVLTYGNNLIRNYYPCTRIARCCLELGDADGAEAWLRRPEARMERREDREDLERRLRDRRAQAQTASQAPSAPVAAAEPQAPAALPPPRTAGNEPAPAPDPEPAARSTAPAAAPSSRPPIQPPPRVAPGARPADPVPPVADQAAPIPGVGRFWSITLALGAGLVIGGLLRKLGRHEGREEEAPSGTGIPVRIGPYRILHRLGRGGFAATYLARHEGTGVRVALKVLDGRWAESGEQSRRFRREADLGRVLDHPAIVRILATGESGGLPWIAMEFVPGQTLEEHLRVSGPLDWPAALAIARPVAEAMAYAHMRGVVHRDLKPANILLHDGQVKVADFGIARVLEGETLTETQAFLGTPVYAAPESQTHPQVGPAADRYAFGVILFEMLAGHPPFEGETAFMLLAHHRKDDFPDLAALRPDLPPGVIRLVQRLSAKEPSDRPEDGELLRILGELSGTEEGPGGGIEHQDRGPAVQ